MSSNLNSSPESFFQLLAKTHHEGRYCHPRPLRCPRCRPNSQHCPCCPWHSCRLLWRPHFVRFLLSCDGRSLCLAKSVNSLSSRFVVYFLHTMLDWLLS